MISVMKSILHRIHERCGDLWWYAMLLFVAQRFGDVRNMFVGMWLVPKYVPQEELGAVLPESVLVMIEELNPCRLSFVMAVFIIMQSALTIILLFDVFYFNSDSRKKTKI